MQFGTKSKCRLRRGYHSTWLMNIRNLHKIAIIVLLLTLIITINGQDEPEEEDEAGAEADQAGGAGDQAAGEAAGEAGGGAAGAGEGGAGAGGAADSGGAAAAGGDTNDDKQAFDSRYADDHGTVHEKLGQAHYPLVELTEYRSNAYYTSEKNYTTWPMHPAYNITHFIFDTLISSKPALPPGYLVVKNQSTLALGPKVEENDWRDLLAEYFLLIVLIFLLLTLVVLMPFIAVCYCCFCCCRRCKLGCPPCDGPQDKRSNLICSSILIALVLLLFIGLLIAFVATRFLDRGFDDTTNTMKRGSQDTCTFLQDVSNHIHHVFVYNYEELEAHLIEVLNEASNHIFLDLADASESNAAAELERILNNMREAKRIMDEVMHMEHDLRFNAANLRDGLRGLKRDVTYTCSILVSGDKCKDLIFKSMLQFLDTYHCLHLDKLPHSEIFLDAMEKVLKSDVDQVPKRALARFQKIGVKISEAMETAVPPLRMDISRGHDLFQKQALKMHNIIDAIISDIHFRTLESTKSFEDIHDKLGTDRSALSLIVCLFILLILLALIAALIFGCCINKLTGTHFLLVAMILIFIAFSLVLLMAVFYLVIGLISYQGACAPLRDQEANILFSQLDSEMDLNRFIPASGADRDEAIPMRMSHAIKACMANESIFHLLKDNHIFDTDDLMNIKVMPEGEGEGDDEKRGLNFEEDLSQIFLLTHDERAALDEVRLSNLSDYRSTLYSEQMCKRLTPSLVDIQDYIHNVSDAITSISNEWNDFDRVGRISLKNEGEHLYHYYHKYYAPTIQLINKMNKKLADIDELILYENRNFSNSIEVLVGAILRSEDFLKTKGALFINSLGENLTDVINNQIDIFIEGSIHECNYNIGRCGPLAYIYYRGVDLICYRLVDPLNAFWLGLFICCIAFIPILFVCHRLMCLWKRLHSYLVAPIAVLPIAGCPTCTGAPYVPPPIITCVGGNETFCVCSEGRQNRTDGGAAPSESDLKEQIEAIPATSSAVISVPPPVPPKATKRKED